MLLFSAPIDFAPVVKAEYEAAFNVLWLRTPIPLPIEAWVCDPTASFVIGAEELGIYPNLKVLATPSTGTNHIDLAACKARGVKVLSLLDDRPGLERISASAEWTFALLLQALRLKKPYHELQNKIVGLIGYGRIGRKVEAYCNAFGAVCWAYDPYRMDAPDSLADTFQNCDAVVVCCALTPETAGMIGRDLIASMKPEAALVNTARGEVIREGDLLEVMAERPDLRVALDVVDGEVEGRADREALRRAGALVTPHIAGETYESRTKAARIILGLLQKETI